MAYTVTANIPLNMPTPGTREPAQIALLNDNCVVLSNHDHTTGKALAVGRLRSGLAASRPTASSAGNVYFATDTGLMSMDNGTAWVDFITNQGQVNLTDPIIRDTLQFGAKPNGAVDYTVRRVSATGMQFSGNVGVGVAPAAWGAGFNAVQLGLGAFWGAAAGPGTWLSNNTRFDGTNRVALTNAPANQIQLESGYLNLWTAPSVAAGAAQTFTTRLTVDHSGRSTITADNAALTLDDTTASGDLVHLSLNRAGGAQWHLGYDNNQQFVLYNGPQTKRPFQVAQTGTVTLTPDAGQAALAGTLNGSAWSLSPGISPAGGGSPRLVSAAATWIEVNPGGGAFVPSTDNAVAGGYSNNRWTALYAVAGSINTSAAEAKQDITPLDPASCSQAVLSTEWVSFRYRDPVFSEPEPLPGEGEDDLERRTAEQYTTYLNRLEETAFSRKQRGYVLGSTEHRVSDLFGLADRRSASPSSDLAVVACALQSALQRIAALEARGGQSATA